MAELKELRPTEPIDAAKELKDLHAHERINAMLNIINKMPIQGFDQWNPAVEVMKGLATLDNDLKQIEQKLQTADGAEGVETE